MSNRLRQFLAEIERPEPPAGLLKTVMERVAETEEKLGLRRRLVLLAFLTATLLGVLGWTFSAVRTAMSGSGNLEYLTLAFSDTQVVFANWSSYVASVFESLPAGHLAAFLAVTLCLMFSLRALIRVSRQAFDNHHHHAFNY